MSDTSPANETAERQFWGAARVVVGMLAVLLFAIGGGATVAVWQGMGIWLIVLAALGIGGGIWFFWVALRGSRNRVDSIVSEGILKLLDEVV